MRIVPVSIGFDYIDEIAIVATFAWVDAGMVDAGEQLRMVILPAAFLVTIVLN